MRRDLSTWLGTLRTTSRTARYRRSNRPLKARGAAAKISLAGGEPLDGRKMLAVTANLVGTGLTIALDADNDIAGLVFNTGTSKYEVYDDVTLVDSFDAANVSTIIVIDTKGSGQVFEVRNGGTITASLGVSSSVETTKIFDDINVTSIPGGFGVVISSPTIILDDATIADRLLIQTDKTTVEFGGEVTLVGGTDAHVGTGAGAGDIKFLDDILGGGEDGSGTLTLSAGTGAITFGGDIGGTGEDQALLGVKITDAASVSATGKFYLEGTDPAALESGLTIGAGVNNVNLPNGGKISGFASPGNGIFFEGSSTNSTIKLFELFANGDGINIGNGGEDAPGPFDLSGTVIDNNRIYDNEYDGIDFYNVAGNLDGEDAFVIGGTKTGNSIYGNGYDGIYGRRSSGVEIVENTIYGNGFDFGGNGISLEEGGEYLIADNTIGEDTVGPGSQGNAVNGILIDGEDGFYSYAGTVLFQNGILSNLDYGVRVQGVTVDTGEDSILILSNDIINNGFTVRAPIDVGGVRIDGSENIRIISNFIGFNGEDSGNGVDIVNGSHGTIVFSNDIIENTGHGVYVENSSILANPVRIGDILPTVSSTASSITVSGDQRAVVVVGQYVWLFYATDPTDIATVTVPDAGGIEVLGVTYDSETDETTLTFASVSGAPAGVSLGNAIAGNGEDGVIGHGINVLATGEGVGGVVQGLEIIGNVVVSNGLDGMHLEATRAANNGDLSDIVIAGNFIGREPTAFGGLGEDLGNFDDGIEVVNGDDFLIVSNYVAANGGASSDINDYNGIEIRTSQYIDIGEDGFGNYIVRNANDGVDIKGSSYVAIIDNDINNNGTDGIHVEALRVDPFTRSSFIEIEGNRILDNGEDGIDVSGTDSVVVLDNLVAGNDGDGARLENTTDADVGFNVIRDNNGDGVVFFNTNGVIEGNEIYDNTSDGVFIDDDSSPYGPPGGAHFEILGNIIRNNGDDGVDIRNGNFYGEDRDGEYSSSRVAGNTIELNDDNGVALSSVNDVLVGGEFPSDINFINLNGNAGVYATGYTNADVIGNEIDSNVNFGVEIDGGEDLLVGDTTDEAVNTIRRNGIAGVYAYGETYSTSVFNNEISENPVGVMITSALGLQVGGPNFEGEAYGNHIFDNGEGVRATGDSYGTAVQGNLIEDNLTCATLASVRGLTFGYGEAPRVSPEGAFGNVVQNNNEGLRGSGDLTDTVVAGNDFIDNTKVGIALQSAKNLTVGGFGEDSPNLITGSPVGLSASGTMVGTEVVGNEFSDNTIGIALSKATGMVVGGNTIDASGKYGISVTGNNADTLIVENTVTNTQGQPGFEHGIYLNDARNVDVIDNTVSESKGAGIYVTGNTLGTVVQGNYLDGNRFGIAMINAQNAVIGGSGEDEGNTIVGGGSSITGDYRDGIYASGNLTGSSITGTDITNASTGVLLESAQGLLVTDTTVTDSQRFGFFARGDNAGTRFTNSTITGTGGVPSTEHGMMLFDAKNLLIEGNTVSDSLGAGLYLTGDNSGTEVYDNDFDGNRFGIAFINATNTDIGGDAPGEDNRIVGGGDPGAGEYRDGIYAAGVNTGSSITQTKISSCWTGINLESATGFTVTDASVLKATGFGIYAKGVNTGTLLDDINVEQDPVSSSSNGSILQGAEGLTIDNSTFTGDGTAIYVIGGANGTIIE
ncbi:MAG: beta strand repeat-containing protein, partial [Planctomycetia bacterium]